MRSLGIMSGKGRVEACVLLILALVSAVLGFHAHTVFGDASVFPLVAKGQYGQYEGWYRWPGVYPWRSAFFALASLLFVVTVWRLGSRGSAGAATIEPRILASRTWGLVTWSVDDDGAGELKPLVYITVKELVLWMIVGLALVFLAIFLFQPKNFTQISLDDGPVESASALMLFVSSGVFFVVASRTLQAERRSDRVFRSASAAIALFLFFAGMEEISWGQRIFDLKTPRSFAANRQGELNLHNFNVNFFNTSYYMLGFLLFILLPFLKDRLEALRKVEILSFFIPSRFVLFASAIGLAYTWATWSELIYQISFFVTLFILIGYAWHLRSIDKIFLPALVAVYLLTQILLILYGRTLVYHWEVNEYKEFFIPLSFLIYSLEMLENSASRTLRDRSIGDDSTVTGDRDAA
jgi:hypothetical protein